MLNEDNIQMIVDAGLERNYPLMAVVKVKSVISLISLFSKDGILFVLRTITLFPQMNDAIMHWVMIMMICVKQMAEVAALCLDKVAGSRPDMSTVLRSLKNASWETQTCLRKRQQLSQRVLSPEEATSKRKQTIGMALIKISSGLSVIILDLSDDWILTLLILAVHQDQSLQSQ